MSYLDWAIIVGYLSFMIFDGIRMTKHSNSVDGYFLANKSLPWWAVGLSVMATQLSAITLVGTTGQAYSDGMRFIQFYFGLPVAMILLCLTVVKFFHNANVYTAYEYLERRFDVRVRTLTSFFFLISRGLAAGVVIAAPSIILSIVLGWNLTYTIFALGLTTTCYTMFGGVQAVTWTDVKQMFIIFFGLGVCIFIIISKFPAGVGLTDGLQLAGAVNKLNTVDFKVDFTEQYTFWSGLIGGTFLALAYFGCDQSQVQRFLTAKSVDEGRTSLLMSAFLKIPMQFFILLIGIMVFVFYQFQAPPMIFNPNESDKAAQAQEYKGLQENYDKAFENRKNSAFEFLKSDSPEAKQKYIESNNQFNDARKNTVDFVKKDNKDFNDVNYVFPTFVLQNMPIGVVGLIIAAIFAAAMSTIAAELNALATTTTLDFYRRLFKPEAKDSEYLLVGKFATLGWGLFACVAAIFSTNLGSLIEVINKFGSFFYGSLLGVFMLAFLFPRARSRGAFFGILIGISSVAILSYYTKIAFLWFNVIGCVVTVIAGLLISLTVSKEDK
ncbi:MAG TPA: sodium:solute symporter [Pyrinomonadaceae bacterium]|nr:sodium:solute symporter [Pyrinomonadaceae bacterium]